MALRKQILAIFALIAAAAIAGCGGGGGAASVPVTQATATPQPTATATLAPASSSASVTAGTAPASAVFGTITGGWTGGVTLPAATAGASNVALTFSLSSGSLPVVQSIRRAPAFLGGTFSALVYVTMNAASAVSFASAPSFSFALPAGVTVPAGGQLYIAVYDPTNASAGWTTFEGPATMNGTAVAVASNGLPFALTAGQTYAFVLFSTTQMRAVPSPTPSPLPAPTASPPPGPSLIGPGTPLTGPAAYLSGGRNRGWTPSGVASQLQYPIQNGWDGRGESVAIVMDTPVDTGDIATYLAAMGVTPTGSFSMVSVDGASLTQAAGGEATLDTETIRGLAPGANLKLYVVPSLSQTAFNDALTMIASDRSATIVNYSASGCEAASPPATSALLTAYASTFVLVASAGDQGSTCHRGSDGYVTGVGYPSSDPNVISAGGTETANTSDPTSLRANTVWNDTLAASGHVAGGGGVSTLFALPSFQRGYASLTSQTFRNVPDIALPAVRTAVYRAGAWGTELGTSWSSPEMVALVANVYQYCNVTVVPNAVTLPYAVFATAKYNAFIDVVNGNNAYELTAGGLSPAYAGTTGPDNVGGIGVPMGMPFAETACPNRTLSSRARASASVVANAATRHSEAYTVDVTPRAANLRDMGRRAGSDDIAIQLVIAPDGAAANENAAIAVLQQAGLHVTRQFANHLVVDAAGATSAVEALFGTQIDNVQQNASAVYMPVRAVTVPASLAPYVGGVVLDNVVNFFTRR